MGMTDRQFDAYQKTLLQSLRRAAKEIEEIKPNAKSESLEVIIRDIEDQLKRP